MKSYDSFVQAECIYINDILTLIKKEENQNEV